MSRQKLTIIVACTDRKSVTPTDELMVRNLPKQAVNSRAKAWREALEQSTGQRPLLDLYQGETWGQVRALARTARSIGFEPRMLVASAGLGLQCITSAAPAYAATFNTGHADSVGASPSEAEAWWRALPQTPVQRGGRAMWILSEAYSRVISHDLLKRMSPDELLVFGGSNDVPAGVRVPSDRSLRRALGGTVTSLNVRAAIQWLTLSDGHDPFGTSARENWRIWSDANRYREVFDRQPMSDTAVLEFVETLRAHQPTISKTSALKVLRESGRACEQRRFSTLFQQAARP